MKSKLMTALFTAATVIGFAAEPIALPSPTPRVQGFDTQSDYNSWRSYVRLGLSNSRPSDVSRLFPDLGLGVRFGLPLGTIDLSSSYMGDNPFTDKDKTYFYTLPRVSYLLHLSPERNQSLYGGLGLAFGGLRTKEQTTFHGIIPSLSVGFEMNRLQRMSNFFQIDVSQPALATSLSKPFVDTVNWDLGPVVQLSAGCGF